VSAPSTSKVLTAGSRLGLCEALRLTKEDAAAAMIAVAHPDDETIGIGGHLSELIGPLVVHATDGAPRDMEDARRHGFASHEAYASARRAELEEAMREVGISADALLQLGVADQEAARHMPDLARKLAVIFDNEKTKVVFTHALEGGHPDHDAVAFAVRAAHRLLKGQGKRTPVVIDMPFYRAETGRMVTQSFGPTARAPETVLPLCTTTRESKRRMLACFRTQQETLASFHLDAERFRRAPAYDFARLPNGVPLYESFSWGVKGAEWVTLARAALAELGLQPCR
jgi:N-acetylglucosamine malate deacetylase 2